ncbi:MAG: NAD-dependent epimerase/dehydratase family protein [Promethearchaeota archaeon]|nr:MAG: NAD-dependent epimerase/dehydratase family protein [Candidatus Lokiarchaeota archaeon]
MQKIIITGANGFLGSHLTDFCIRNDYKIYALDLPGCLFKNLTQYVNENWQFNEDQKLKAFNENIQIPTTNKNLTILECDVKNRILLEKIIQEVNPKYIFHFGAQPLVIPSWEDPINTIETNVIGTINIFEPIKKNKLKTKVIVACTSAEYGTTVEKINRPLKETDALMAIHPYGISKIATELISRQYYLNFGIEIVNIRFFNQTGPRKVGDACADFVSKVAQIDLGLTEPVIEVGNLEPFRDFTGIKDTLQGIWLAAIKGKNGDTYNICSGRKTQIREILNIALSFSSKKIEIKENVPHKLRKTDENVILGDNSKIKKELGFEITQSIKDILKDMFDYWIDYYNKEKE